MVALRFPLLVGLVLALASVPDPRAVRAVRGLVAERLGVAAEDVDVEWLGLGRPLRCPPGAEVRAEARPGEDFHGHADIRLVGVADGEVCDEVRLRPRLRVWVRAPVAAAAAAPGEEVRLAVARVPLERVIGVPVDPDGGPWLARRPLEPGEVVVRQAVRPRPDARSGAAVEIVAERGGLLVRAEGRLVSDARLGERVRAVNLATGVVVEGVLAEPGRVRVGGGS